MNKKSLSFRQTCQEFNLFLKLQNKNKPIRPCISHRKEGKKNNEEVESLEEKHTVVNPPKMYYHRHAIFKCSSGGKV